MKIFFLLTRFLQSKDVNTLVRLSAVLKKNYNFIAVDQHQYFDGKVECFFLIVFQDAIIRTLIFKNANI